VKLSQLIEWLESANKGQHGVESNFQFVGSVHLAPIKVISRVKLTCLMTV
jgi:hypothetical protein